ncbi:MAG: GNAT family N-acetyltransferase [Frankiales bacterium]|nr:GNAT family N-acetyltransferase [Frankiales bacterium]
MELRVEPYDGPVAQALIAAVQQEYVERYGGPDDAPVDPGEFAPPYGCFVVAYDGAEPVATGALRRAEDGAAMEIKRMYVRPEWRGRGLARFVLADLERRARDLGATRIVLETGDRQPEAIRLYETSGYARIDGYGHYACSPLSVSFGKDL